MRYDPDDRSEVWDVADPAGLLRRMASALPFVPGEIRLATVENASTQCRFLGQLRLEPAVVADADEDSYDGFDRRRRLLGEALGVLPVGLEGPGPPWTTVVIVSARYGRVVTGLREHHWDEAVHFCNKYTLRWLLRGDHVLLTEHGWLVQGTSLAGATPRLRAAGRRRVSAASTTSSSRAGPA